MINSFDSQLKPLAIVALNSDRVIGRRGDLPWHLSEDLKRFKTLTMGHPVIMGRKTWESLPKRPLPGRQNIVVSRNPEFVAEGAETATSIEEALQLCNDSEPFIIGGGSIYTAALPLCSQLMVTEVDMKIDDADTFFPPIDPALWEVTEATDWETSTKGIPYRFLTYTRK